MLITPDIKFIKKLKKESKSDLKNCMQCGECSVVCELSPEEKPFPRKEMIWAGWGLKDKLIGNPDIWLCHQCGDCSTQCPRGVKPADVLSSLRQINYLHYAKPGFLGKMLGKPSLLPIALAIPTAIILGIVFLAGTLSIPEGPVNYSKFFPHIWLNISFTSLLILVVISMISGLKKFMNDMHVQMEITKKKKGFVKNLFGVFKEIMSHKHFNKCKTNTPVCRQAGKSKKISHMLVFYGFILLLVVTFFAIIATITNNYPLGLWSPVKILGNIAAIMLVFGCCMMFYQRLFNKKEAGASNYFDWIFLISFFILTISGILVELARFQNWSSAYHIYVFHLVFVWFIIIYLPYTKFGHLIYRTIAMAFARSTGRKIGS